MLKTQEAREALVGLAGNERRVSGSTLTFRGNKVGFGSELYEMSPSFEMRLCEMFKIPHKLYSRCSAELQQHMLAELVTGEDRYSVILRNEHADSLGLQRDMFVPAINVFDRIVEVVGPDATFDNISLDGASYDIEVVTDSIKAEPKKGDLTRGGVFVKFGQFDGFSYRTLVGSYLYRLVCQNGQLRRDSENVFVLKRMRSEADALDMLGTLTTQTLESVRRRFLPEFIETSNQIAVHPEQLLRAIAKESHIPNDMVDGMLDLIPGLPSNPSVYDLVNLVTNYANHNNNRWARSKLLYAGGRMVDQTIQRCDHCLKAL